MYTSIAILDFQLSEIQIQNLLMEGLELVASRAKCSLKNQLILLFGLCPASVFQNRIKFITRN
jgi:hypothetical protein